MVDHWLSLIQQYLGQRTVIAALVAGFVISWCMTQWWKHRPKMQAMSDDTARVVTRLVAFVCGFWPVASIWPTADASRWVFAVAVGVSSPMAYTITFRYFFPGLGKVLSARPEEE